MAIVINSAWDAECFYRNREEARKHINSAWDAQLFYETYGGNGQSGNWGSSEWVNRQNSNGAYIYDPITRQWVKSSLSIFNIDDFKLDLEIDDISFSGENLDTVSQSGVIDPNADANSDSKANAEKEYIEIEFNTLTGDVELIPTKNNLKITTGCTINFRGIGMYLSGLYFVSEIKSKIDKDNGYSLTVSLYKNGFGESLKNPTSVISPANDSREDTIDISDNMVNNNIKVGDRVKITGDAVYSNMHEGVKIPNWVKEQVLTIDALSEDGKRARLNPIWSWTYIKYLRLV